MDMLSGKISDPKQRFTNKVTNYARYRPTYPEALFTFLQNHLGLSPYHAVADIGSGTGLSSKWLIKQGNPLYSVEPNANMRLVAEHLFQQFPNFLSMNGAAEDTSLPDNSVDFLLIGQAYHWFDQVKARQELKRILKTGGYAIIVWNERLTESSQFLKQFENLLIRFSRDYMKVDHRNISEFMLANFYGHRQYGYQSFQNCQLFNWEGLKGRLLSMSYAPQTDETAYTQMLDELSRIFRKNGNFGQIKFDYVTRMYFGQLR